MAKVDELKVAKDALEAKVAPIYAKVKGVLEEKIRNILLPVGEANYILGN